MVRALRTLEVMGDFELAQRAAAGDQPAFAVLARRHAALIRWTVRRYHHLDHDLDDLTQEALIGLWDACRIYRPRGAKFSTFAKRCIRRQLADLVRGVHGPKCRMLKERADSELAAEVPHPAETSLVAVQRIELRALATRLPGRLTPCQRRRLADHLNGVKQRHKGDSLHLRKAREKALAVLERAR